MYLAISELMGAQHAARWGNIRFYYNPIAARLEPIGYDGYAGIPLYDLWATLPNAEKGAPHDQLQVRFLDDPIFFEAYLRALYFVTQPTFLPSLLEETKTAFTKQQTILHREFPKYQFSPEILYQNRQFIRYLLYPTEGLRAHLFAQRNDTLLLEVGSTQVLPVEVHAVSWGDSLRFPLKKASLVLGKRETQGIQFTQLAFPVPRRLILNDSTIQHLRVEYAMHGSDSIRSVSVFPHPHSVNEYVAGDLTRNPQPTIVFRFW